MSEYFPKPTRLGGNVKVELDLSNYATKGDLKKSAGVDTSKFAKKVDLASLKSEIDKLDIEKLETAPVDLSKLSGEVRNEVVKKDVYDKLVENVNAIQTTDTSNLVKKLNKLTTDTFAARLAKANLAAKADIDDFPDKTYFDDKPKTLNEEATSNKTKHVETKKKLTDLTNKVA